MALSARDFEKSLPDALAGKRVIVLHGDNIQVKADLFRLIRKGLGIEADDPFRLAQLDSDVIDADPARLGDELGAISMFGGSRLVRVTATAKQAENLVEIAGAAPDGEWLLLVDTDEFSVAASTATSLLAVSCAAETGGSFHQFVRNEFERAGVLLEDGVLEFLIPLLGEDRAAARGEVEKLALLTNSAAPISLQDVKTIVTDASMLVADEISLAALSGDLPALSLALNRLGSAGSDATAALGATSRMILNLSRARANQWNSRPDQPLQSVGMPELRNLVLSVQSAVLQTRSDGTNAALLAERALVSLGHSVKARRR